MQLRVHAEPARPASLGHAIEVVLRLERVTQALFLSLHVMQHIPKGHLAGEALLARRETFAEAETLVALHDPSIDPETPQGGDQKPATGTAHLRYEKGLVYYIELADLIRQRVKLAHAPIRLGVRMHRSPPVCGLQ